MLGKRQPQQRLASGLEMLTAARPMLKVATVEDWWAMTEDYPQYRGVSQTPLKDYGYLALMHQIKQQKPKLPLRVLEFGHGFNPTLFQAFQDTCEMWGVDDCQGLSYFPPRAQWEHEFEEQVGSKCRKARFLRGLMGRDAPSALPENYFDLICSVSVVEEVPQEQAVVILKSLRRHLKPEGMVVNNFDWSVTEPAKYRGLIEAHEAAGFNLGVNATAPPPLNVNELLLENCTTVMCYYRQSDETPRRFHGHWTSLLAKAAPV